MAQLQSTSVTGSLSTTTTITARSATTAASLGGFSVMGAGEFMTTGPLAGYFFENRSGGTVTGTSNWYGWYAASAIVRLYNGSTDIVSINGSSGAITAGSFIRSGGTSAQFLKADGSVDSNSYVTGGPYLALSGGTMTGSISYSTGTAINHTGTGQISIARHTGGGTPVPFVISESSTSNNNDASYGTLHIDRSNITANGAGSNLHFTISGTEYGGMGVTAEAGVSSGSTTGTMRWYLSSGGTTRIQRMTLDSSGNLNTVGSITSTGANINGVWTTTISTSGGWNKLSFVASGAWGDGVTYGVLGAGGGAEPGVMTYNQHATWVSNESGAGIRMGRSGGTSSGAWYQVATMASNEFMIAMNGSWGNGGLKITSDGILRYGNTGFRYVWESGTWGINISGNSATTSQTNFSSLTVNSNAVLHAANFSSYTIRWNSTSAYANGLNNTSVVPNSVTLFDGYGAAVPNYPAGFNQWWVGALTMGDASRGFQIAGGYADSELHFRKGSDGWQAWRRTLTDANFTSFAVPVRGLSNWNDSTVIDDVIGLMAWKNYGNNHVIFDASQSTAPNGTSINNTNSQVAWTGSYPTLMGWNGSNTYGVRVDSARVADGLASMNISQFTNNSGYVTGGPYLPLSGGNITGRVEFQYASDRFSQAWRNNTTGAYWWVTTDSDKLGLHRNADGDKFYFSNGGDFWSSTNGWLSTALSARLSLSGGTMSGDIILPNDTAIALRNAAGNAGFRPDDQWGNTYTWNTGGGYYVDATSYFFRNNTGSTNWLTISSGNGSFSGTISASNISTGVNASHIVQRDANGYIYANHINFNTSESENPGISSFITSNGDGWSRKSSLQHVKNSIRGVADGTWGINITGNAATLGGNGPGYYYPGDTPNGYATGDINGNTTHQRLWGTDSVQNLLAFRPPTSVQYSTNGTTWFNIDVTDGLWDNKIFGKWGGFNMNVGNNIGAWRFVRMTWVNFGYHFFSNFTLAHSTNGHSFNFVFYKSDLNGNFGAEAFRMNGISSWPGYTFVKHSNVSGWWDTRDIRIVFELNHNNDFPNNSIGIGHIGLMGSYSGFTRLYDWDGSRNMYFGNNVTANGSIRSESSMRSPIYYDTDDLTYFLNLSGNGTQSAFLNGNVRINPKSESWAEGLAFVMPSTSTWGGIRWQRQRGGNDGNWYIGYTALDSTDDLVFGANNGGGQVDNIIRLQKDGTVRFRNRTYVHTYGAGGGENLFTGLEAPSNANGRAQFVLSSAYSDLVIASSQSNGNHGSTLTFATYNPGNAGDYRKFVINQGNWGARAGFLDFGFADAGRTNPHEYINSTDDVMSLDGYNKRVGIGVMNPGYALDVVGTIYASADVIAYSDARVKTNIRAIEKPIERLLKSRGVLYDRIDIEDKDNIGFIAQELELEFPELVTTSTDGKKAVKYQNMVAVLTEAIKEQQKQIEELKTKLDALT